jgi:hypothetical protein
MIAGNVGQRSQTGVEIGVEVFHPKPAALDQRRNLVIVVGSSNRAAFQSFRSVANPLHDRGKTLELDAPFPHGDQRLIFWRRSQ